MILEGKTARSSLFTYGLGILGTQAIGRPQQPHAFSALPVAPLKSSKATPAMAAIGNTSQQGYIIVCYTHAKRGFGITLTISRCFAHPIHIPSQYGRDEI